MPRIERPVNWRKLRTFLLTVLALSLIPATRYYQIDVPLVRWLQGKRHVDPLSLHLAGEFVETISEPSRTRMARSRCA